MPFSRELGLFSVESRRLTYRAASVVFGCWKRLMIVRSQDYEEDAVFGCMSELYVSYRSQLPVFRIQEKNNRMHQATSRRSLAKKEMKDSCSHHLYFQPHPPAKTPGKPPTIRNALYEVAYFCPNPLTPFPCVNIPSFAMK